MLQHGPRNAAYALAAVFALAIAMDLLWMPVQVGDSLGEILGAQQSSSTWASFTSSFGTDAYLRPLRIAQIKGLFDLADGGNYWLAYRGFHALLLITAVMLFMRALRVSTIVDFSAAACALVVLVGLHTFRGTVREAFPVNHFLEMVVLCLAMLNLARSRGGLWVDLAAALAFVAAALTLESGLLVWVVAVGAWAVGWRGVSARGLAVMTVLLVAYAYLRFVYLSTGVPELTERSAGYLLERLEPTEIQQRFGSQPLWFYTYNVFASIASVLFSEPQDGVFEAVYSWMNDRPLWRVMIPVVTSISTTALLCWAAARRAFRSAPFDDTARAIVVFLLVLIANATLSFAYAKLEIMSVAGAFYALAVFGAVRDVLLRAPSLRPVVAIGCAALLGTVAIGWSVRAAGVHYVLRSQAVKHQIDWVELPGRWKRDDRWPSDPAEQRLILQLRNEAVHFTLPNTRVDSPEWPSRVWLE
jgi:hypothetical protein